MDAAASKGEDGVELAPKPHLSYLSFFQVTQARQVARERRAILDAQKLDKCVGLFGLFCGGCVFV